MKLLAGILAVVLIVGLVADGASRGGDKHGATAGSPVSARLIPAHRTATGVGPAEQRPHPSPTAFIGSAIRSALLNVRLSLCENLRWGVPAGI